MKSKLKSVIETIENMEKMFEQEDIEVIFALEELKTQVLEIMKEVQ